MAETLVPPANDAGAIDAETGPDVGVADSPFLKALASLIRAEDRYGAWDGKPDEDLIRPYILTKEDRKKIPIIGNPDPDTVERLELFYKAVALRVEKATGLMPSLILKMHQEGFGWAVLIVGRLVAYSRHHRDIHRFGFPTRARLAEEGEKHTATVLEMIEAHAEVARL